MWFRSFGFQQLGKMGTTQQALHIWLMNWCITICTGSLDMLIRGPCAEPYFKAPEFHTPATFSLTIQQRFPKWAFLHPQIHSKLTGAAQDVPSGPSYWLFQVPPSWIAHNLAYSKIVVPKSWAKGLILYLPFIALASRGYGEPCRYPYRSPQALQCVKNTITTHFQFHDRICRLQLHF